MIKIKKVNNIETNDNIVKINDSYEMAKYLFKDNFIKINYSNFNEYNLLNNIVNYFNINIYDLLYFKEIKDNNAKKLFNDEYGNINNLAGSNNLYNFVYSLNKKNIKLIDTYLAIIIENVFSNITYIENKNYIYCVNETSYVFCELLKKYNIIKDYEDFSFRKNTDYFYDISNNQYFKYINNWKKIINTDKINSLEFNINNKHVEIVGSNYVLGNIIKYILEKQGNIVSNLIEKSENLLDDYEKININNFTKFNYKLLFKYLDNDFNIKIINIENISEEYLLNISIEKYTSDILLYCDLNKINKLSYKIIEYMLLNIKNNLLTNVNKLIDLFLMTFFLHSNSIESINIIFSFFDALEILNIKKKNNSNIGDIIKSLKGLIFNELVLSYSKYKEIDYNALFFYIEQLKLIKKDYIKIGNNEIDFLNTYFNINTSILRIFKGYQLFNIDSKLLYGYGYDIEQDKKNIDTLISINNIELHGLFSCISAYRLSRDLTENNKWYYDNIIIEMMLDKLKNSVLQYEENYNNINPIVFRRYFSLLSTYYNLLIRYEIDNENYGIENILNEYLNRLIVSYNSYLDHVDIVTTSKVLNCFSQIQNFYNYFDINKNILETKEYITLMREYSSAMIFNNGGDVIFYDTEYLYENIFDVKKDEVSISSDSCVRKENYYKMFTELIRPYNEVILTKSNKIFVKDKAFYSSLINSLDNDWNSHKKYLDLSAIKSVNNFLDLGFIYE